MSVRELYIEMGLTAHYNEALQLVPREGALFGVFVQGSQNYDCDIYTDEYKSDIDTKAIVLPTFEEFCDGVAPTSRTHVRANEEHIDLKDIRLMFDTFKKQNVNFVEILFTPFFMASADWKKEVDEMRSLGERLTHAHPAQTLRTIAGMSMEKHKALEHPYPTIKWKIDKYGFDGKQLHHIIRINEFAHNYVSGMPFAQCLTTYSDECRELMYKAKLNQFTLEEARAMADKYNQDTDKLKEEVCDKYDGGKTPLDLTPYDDLRDLKHRILRKWFKLEINRESYERLKVFMQHYETKKQIR